jgi:prophage tail gpP-like protein
MADQDTIDLPEITVEPRRVLRPWPRPQQEPKRDETATLVVAGRQFEDWESIWLQNNLAQVPPQFRFTAAERDPIPTLWQRLQFKPGDDCQLYLGGLLAMTGMIITRQVAYENRQHGVVLQGVAQTWAAARASILDKESQFKGGFVDVAGQVLAPTGVGFKVIGTIDPTPYKPAAKNEPGEPIFSFLERIGRQRKVMIGTDPYGNFLFFGDHGPRPIDELIEGINILKMQCVISDEKLYNEYVTRAQTGRSDEGTPKDAAHQEAKGPGTLKWYSPLLTVIEHPVWTPKEVALRNTFETNWHEGQKIEATITVQGWFTRAGRLWNSGDDVLIKSPMAMLNMGMKIQSTTFTQDSRSGSLTTLLCVPPWRFNGQSFATSGDLPPPPASKPVNPNPTSQ